MDRKREIASRRRARSGAGKRGLIFQARLDPNLGVPTATTLGPSANRNPDSRAT